MKRLKPIAALFMSLTIAISGFTSYASAETNSANLQLITQPKISSYQTAVEANKTYGLELTKKLLTFRSNTDTGYRTSGSQAELDAGNMLKKEMEAIGLSNVHKDEITVDGWEYKKGEITFLNEKGEKQTEQLGGQAVQFVSKNEAFDLVYAEQGTSSDLENVNVEGKWILIEINQSEDWWVNYPAYQAYLKKAKGVIAINVAGYGEKTDDTIVTQDICGPEYAPIFTVSVNTGNQLKQSIEKSSSKSISINLNIDSSVMKDTKSYNIIGEIKGKTDDMIVLAAHYDAYWDGFQDDGTAIGMIYSIAKAICDSGYKPDKTIVVIAHGAEEWGIVNSRYDWAVGSQKQITKNTPEWSNKIAAMINFESPGMKQQGYALIRTCYEYNDVINNILKEIKDIPTNYTEALKTEYPLRSWSDDFAYQTAGVPAFRNGYTDPQYDSSIYHTPLDNESTYDEADFLFQQKLYGMLLMAFDNYTILPMDFSLRFTEMKNKIGDIDIYKDAGLNHSNLSKAIDDVIVESTSLYKRINNNQGQPSTAMNKKLLDAFKFAEDHFTKLTWEDALIFPNQHGYNNIKNISESIKCLENNDGKTPIDEYLFHVDNNWYAYNFDRPTYNFFTQQVLNQPADRLSWGAGKIIGHCDLYSIIESLNSKYDTVDTDYSNEIGFLKIALEKERSLFNTTVNNQIKDLQAFKTMLQQIK